MVNKVREINGLEGMSSSYDGHLHIWDLIS